MEEKDFLELDYGEGATLDEDLIAETSRYSYEEKEMPLAKNDERHDSLSLSLYAEHLCSVCGTCRFAVLVGTEYF